MPPTIAFSRQPVHENGYRYGFRCFSQWGWGRRLYRSSGCEPQNVRDGIACYVTRWRCTIYMCCTSWLQELHTSPNKWPGTRRKTHFSNMNNLHTPQLLYIKLLCKTGNTMQTRCELRNHAIQNHFQSKRATSIAARVCYYSARMNLSWQLWRMCHRRAIFGGLRKRAAIRVAPSASNCFWMIGFHSPKMVAI